MQFVTDVQIYVGDMVREHEAAITLAIVAILAAIVARTMLRPKFYFGNIKGDRGEHLLPRINTETPWPVWPGLRWQKPHPYHRKSYDTLELKSPGTATEEPGFQPLVQFSEKRGRIFKRPAFLTREAA